MLKRKKMGHRRVLFLKCTLSLVVILLTFSGVRISLALRQVNQPMAASDGALLPLGTTNNLKITPVFEAWVRSDDFHSGHGVAYLVETDHATILLDLGNNEQGVNPSPLDHNLRQLDVNVSRIDAVVITHNHPDHVGGVAPWRRGSFVIPEGSTAKVYAPVRLGHATGEVVVGAGTTELAPGVAILGPLPFLNPFPFTLWDPLEWEQSLVINVAGKGLVVIMGCGHPSMQRVVLQAEAQFGLPVVGVFGGMHYLGAGEQELRADIEFLLERKPELIALSPHDSKGSVLQTFAEAFPEEYRYITVGWPIVLPEIVWD